MKLSAISSSSTAKIDRRQNDVTMPKSRKKMSDDSIAVSSQETPVSPERSEQNQSLAPSLLNLVHTTSHQVLSLSEEWHSSATLCNHHVCDIHSHRSALDHKVRCFQCAPNSQHGPLIRTKGSSSVDITSSSDSDGVGRRDRDQKSRLHQHDQLRRKRCRLIPACGSRHVRLK
eukprot:2998576-Amphidinium_carterae.3